MPNARPCLTPSSSSGEWHLAIEGKELEYYASAAKGTEYPPQSGWSPANASAPGPTVSTEC